MIKGRCSVFQANALGKGSAWPLARAWHVLSGYGLHKDLENALKLFREMPEQQARAPNFAKPFAAPGPEPARCLQVITC